MIWLNIILVLVIFGVFAYKWTDKQDKLLQQNADSISPATPLELVTSSSPYYRYILKLKDGSEVLAWLHHGPDINGKYKQIVLKQSYLDKLWKTYRWRYLEDENHTKAKEDRLSKYRQI